MSMRIHQIHPALVHFPLVLLPVSAAVDLASAGGGSMAVAGIGKALWWAASAAVVLASISGLAASQAVKAESRSGRDMMWVHGMGNAAVSISVLTLAAVRTFFPPSVILSVIGFAVWGLSLYTAYLGGELVYDKGIGVRAMPESAKQGVLRSPPVFSAAAPGAFVRDAVRGMRWLLSRAVEVVTGKKPVDPAAFGLGEEEKPDKP